MSFWDRLQHGWNAFVNNRDPTVYYRDIGAGYGYRPDRPRFTRGSERTILMSIYNRIALDAAAINIQHCRLDDDGRFVEPINSKLNTCLTLRANIDQTSRAFIQDAVISMLDEGHIAIIAVDTTFDPNVTDSYDVESMRVGKIVEWFPAHVRVNVYNDRTGQKKNIIVSKKECAIIENPFYSVMNEPNSTMQRLIRKLNLSDVIDEQTGANKLDLIIQLPYVVKSPTRKQQAEERRKDIETQLASSKYGVAYTDGTERITQLNRPVENNLMSSIEYLTRMLFGQLSINQEILDGTANDATMLNYYSRTVEPIVAAIVDGMKCAFLTKTARSQKQSIVFFRDVFQLVPVNEIAKVADTFTRNEIMTSNEIRQKVGMKPSKDPRADQLINSNISQPNAKGSEESKPTNDLAQPTAEENKEGEIQNG